MFAEQMLIRYVPTSGVLALLLMLALAIPVKATPVSQWNGPQPDAKMSAPMIDGVPGHLPEDCPLAPEEGEQEAEGDDAILGEALPPPPRADRSIRQASERLVPQTGLALTTPPPQAR